MTINQLHGAWDDKKHLPVNRLRVDIASPYLTLTQWQPVPSRTRGARGLLIRPRFTDIMGRHRHCSVSLDCLWMFVVLC